MKVTIRTANVSPQIPTEDVRIGRVALADWGGQDRVLLRTFESFVDLRQPRDTWPTIDCPKLVQDILPPGTEIVLEVEESSG